MKSLMSAVFSAALWLSASVAHAEQMEGFNDRYVIRTGDLNSDGKVDVYLQYQPVIVPIEFDDLTVPVPLKGPVSEFVLQQDSAGGFTPVVINASQKGAVSSWARTTSMELIFGDFNMDGRPDAILKNVASVISGAKDAIIYGPSTNGGVPTFARAIDAPMQLFFKDSHGYVEDPHYFDSGFFQACQPGYYWVLVPSYDELGNIYWDLEYVPVTVCGTFFDPTGFSVPSINFMNTMVAPSQAGELVPGSADAVSISDQLETLLGVPVFRSSLESSSAVNTDKSLPEFCRKSPGDQNQGEKDTCNSIYVTRAWVQMLRDFYVKVTNCFGQPEEAHHYEVENTICTVGSARCNLGEVYQNEMLLHPVIGYWDQQEPIYNVATSTWNPPAPQGVATMGCTRDIPKACDMYEIYNGGRITFDVTPSTYTHKNTTAAGHLFDPGSITRNAFLSGSQLKIKTVGEGTGACPRTNEVSGSQLFNMLDKFIVCHMQGGCSLTHPVGS